MPCAALHARPHKRIHEGAVIRRAIARGHEHHIADRVRDGAEFGLISLQLSTRDHLLTDHAMRRRDQDVRGAEIRHRGVGVEIAGLFLAGELHAHRLRPGFEIFGDGTRDGAIGVSWLGISRRAAFAPGSHVDGVALLCRKPAHHVERVQLVAIEDDFIGVDFPMNAIRRDKADEPFLAA